MREVVERIIMNLISIMQFRKEILKVIKIDVIAIKII
jgi:hypothetical protein